MPALISHLSQRPERLNVNVQAKVLQSEYDALVAMRDELHAAGLTDVTISSLLRTSLNTLLAAWAAEKAGAAEGAAD